MRNGNMVGFCEHCDESMNVIKIKKHETVICSQNKVWIFVCVKDTERSV